MLVKMSSVFYKLLDVLVHPTYNGSIMKHLTIKQVEKVFGWSYPTALQYGQRFGRQDGDGQKAKWLVPLDVVEADLKMREDEVRSMRDRLVAISSNGQ